MYNLFIVNICVDRKEEEEVVWKPSKRGLVLCVDIETLSVFIVVSFFIRIDDI